MGFFSMGLYKCSASLRCKLSEKMNKQENRGVYLVDKTEKRRAFLVDNCFPVF